MNSEDWKRSIDRHVSRTIWMLVNVHNRRLARVASISRRVGAAPLNETLGSNIETANSRSRAGDIVEAGFF